MTPSSFCRLGVLAVMMVVQGCMAQSQQKTKARPAAEQERVVVRRTVQGFLEAWLVSRDLETAKKALGVAAIRNEAILQETCAGYIKPEERSSEDARRGGIEKFLQDFVPSPPVQRLGQALNGTMAVQMGAQLGASLANDPKVDGFVLARLRRDQIPTSSTDVKDYLRTKLPEEFYAAFVPIGSGAVYFIWVREGSEWRIAHASLVCI